MTPSSPEALMRRVQEDDSAAYAQLLNEITPVLRRVIRRQRAFLNASFSSRTLAGIKFISATHRPAPGRN